MPIPTTMLSAALCATMLFAPDPEQRTVEQDGKEVVQAPLTGLQSPALAGFRLRFVDGDHQVRRIGVTVSNDAVRGILSDANGRDDISLRAHYRKAPVYRPAAASKQCRGTCTIPIVAPPNDGNFDWQLVLVGFSFDNLGSGDSKVRKLEIRPASDRRSYRVELRDNGTFDFKANLQYAWIRGDGLTGRTTVTGARKPGFHDQTVKMGKVSAARMLIAGFSFEFGNGDHNLRDLAIERDTDRQYYVRFNDANYDDPMTATLDLVWM
jgi:hypothetical protein